MEVISTPAIKGESRYAGHIDQINITNLSQGNESCVSFGSSRGPTVCTPTIGQVNFNMDLNTAAIGFRAQMFLGMPMDKVDIFFESSGGTPVTYQKIRMEDVYVVGVEEVANEDGRPTVQVILQATKIGWLYYKIDERTGKPDKEPLKTGWDVLGNKTWTPLN